MAKDALARIFQSSGPGVGSGDATARNHSVRSHVFERVGAWYKIGGCHAALKFVASEEHLASSERPFRIRLKAQLSSRRSLRYAHTRSQRENGATRATMAAIHFHDRSNPHSLRSPTPQGASITPQVDDRYSAPTLVSSEEMVPPCPPSSPSIALEHQQAKPIRKPCSQHLRRFSKLSEPVGGSIVHISASYEGIAPARLLGTNS